MYRWSALHRYVYLAMVGVLLLLSRGPLPKRVYHDGHWHTVKPGTTREEMVEELGDQDAHDRTVVDPPGEGGAHG